MGKVIPLLLFSVLAQLAAPQDPYTTPVIPVLEIVSGDSRIFSGDSARLKCNIPDHRSTWTCQWFRGSTQLPQSGEQLSLWRAHVKESGKYYCQGVRDTAIGQVYTLRSHPLEINVDGGWAILYVPPSPGLVGQTLAVTCRVRGTPPLREVILFKDGEEVMRQEGLNPHFNLTNLVLEDNGVYYCRASWDTRSQTHSVISVETPVRVVEFLSQPVLEIDVKNEMIPANMMKLICHHEYNAPAPAPPVHYFFYQNNSRLGMASSENHELVERTPGQYKCKVKVSMLDLTKWSEPKTYGQVSGTEMVTPPITHPPPPVVFPDPTQSPAAEPTAARPLPHPSIASPTFVQPTKASTQPLAPPALQPTPNTFVSTVKQTATPKTVNTYEQSGDMQEESGDMSGESGDMSGESGDMSQDSPDVLLW